MEVKQLGMVGLGRMGSNLVRRFVRAGGSSVVFDNSFDAAASLREELNASEDRVAVTAASTLQELTEQLEAPRIIWVMVPAEVTGQVLDDLAPLLSSGDLVIDGGNSNWRLDKERAQQLSSHGVDFLDVGTSGGVWGLERGYCLMVGGPQSAVERAAPVLEVISPSPDSVDRTVGRQGPLSPAEHGWLHCGPNGAGHFVKMVHNGIEYGMMAAYAEGFNLLSKATAYDFDVDGAEVAELWRRGSVVGSWLLDLTASAYVKNPELSEFSGVVSDSGEGRWTLDAGIDLAVPMPVLASALFSRFASRDEDHHANQLLSAMRNEFGGHVEPPASAAPTAPEVPNGGD